MNEKEINKIKMPTNEIYDIKDELLRHQINVLLGLELPNEYDLEIQDKE